MQKLIPLAIISALFLPLGNANVYASQKIEVQEAGVKGYSQKRFNARKFADGYLKFLTDKNLETASNYYAQDVSFRDMATGASFQGIQEVKKFLQEQFTAIPDLKFKTLDVIGKNSEKIAVQWLMTGTDQGKPFEIEGVSVMELKQGKIAKITDYYK